MQRGKLRRESRNSKLKQKPAYSSGYYKFNKKLNLFSLLEEKLKYWLISVFWLIPERGITAAAQRLESHEDFPDI
jgi:hypothetical protein